MLSGPSRMPTQTQHPQELILCLHGYGANGADLITLSESWRDILPHALFFSPNAPFPCDVMPGGYQWFGLENFSLPTMRAGLDRAVPFLLKTIESLLHQYQLPPSALTLVGFSQGTMMALEMAFHIGGLRGIIGFSGAFYPPPFPQKPRSPKAPILLIHGDMDAVVPYPAFIEAQRTLKTYGFDVKGHTCSLLPHTISAEGITVAREFLTHIYQQPTVLCTPMKEASNET